MRVLIVEDEERLAELIQHALSEEGLAADIAFNGEEALAWVETAPLRRDRARRHAARHRRLRGLPAVRGGGGCRPRSCC